MNNRNKTALFSHAGLYKHAETDKIFNFLVKSGINVNVKSAFKNQTILVDKCISNYEQAKILIEDYSF